MKHIHISLMMLRVVDAVAKSGSYTRASDQLGLTQSGVSHAMRGWEDALGAPLAERNGHRFDLTPLGEAVLREARGALDHVELIRRLADRKALTGHIRLGTVASAAIALVPPALDTLRRSHPNLSIELFEGTDSEVRKWFEHGIVDVAIAMDKLGKSAKVLCNTELVAVMPRHHPLGGSRVIKPADLAEYPFVMSASGCEPSIVSHVKAAGAALDVMLRVRDSRALLAAVRSGLGLTVLPTLTVEASPDGLIHRPLHPSLRCDLNIGIADTRSEAARELANALHSLPLCTPSTNVGELKRVSRRGRTRP